MTPGKSRDALERPALIALISADRVDAGDLRGVLAWAATHESPPEAKAGALVGAASALLQPKEKPSPRDMSDLLPNRK